MIAASDAAAAEDGMTAVVVVAARTAAAALAGAVKSAISASVAIVRGATVPRGIGVTVTGAGTVPDRGAKDGAEIVAEETAVAVTDERSFPARTGPPPALLPRSNLPVRRSRG